MKPKFERQKQIFEYRMTKNSVEKEIYVLLKPRNCWEDGFAIEKLINEVSKRMNRIKKANSIRKRKEYSEERVREALSLLNKFGKNYGIYIKSDYGWFNDNDGNKIKEFRYFVPKQQNDITREKDKLENVVDVVNLKENTLTHYEEETIKQEQQLETIRTINEPNDEVGGK